MGKPLCRWQSTLITAVTGWTGHPADPPLACWDLGLSKLCNKSHAPRQEWFFLERLAGWMQLGRVPCPGHFCPGGPEFLPLQSCGVRSLDGWVPVHLRLEDWYLRANHNTPASVSSSTGQQGTAGTLLLSSTHQHLHREGLTSIPCTLQPLERIPALAISPVISTSGARGPIKPTSAPGQEWFFLEHAWAQRPPRAPHLIKSKAQITVYTIPP